MRGRVGDAGHVLHVGTEVDELRILGEALYCPPGAAVNRVTAPHRS
jgi:hypothetical protein